MPEDLTQVGLRLSYSALFDNFDGSRRVDVANDPRVDATLASVAVRHFFGDGWSLDAELPAGLVRYRASDRPSARLTGFGDLRFAGRYDFAALWGPGGYRPSVTLSLGLGLPTGRTATVMIPGVPPSQLSVGAGVFALDAAVEATQFVHRAVALRAAVGGRAPLTATTGGLVFGPTLSYSAGALALVDRTVLSLDVVGRSRGRAEELGIGTVLRSGGTLVAVAAGVSHRVADDVTLAVNGSLPVWRQVNGPQVSETYSVGAAVILAFGGAKEDEHEHGDDHGHDDGEHGHGHDDAHGPGHGDAHGHDAGDAHDHGPPGPRSAPRGAGGPSTRPASRPRDAHPPPPRGDVLDLRAGGASFPIEAAVVPEKVTVVDFWAEWCAPCVDLDRRLRALAAERDDLAVRRVEVPSFDSPVAKAHLSTVSALPVVWIFDREGRPGPRLEGESPDAILKAVRAALDPR